MNINLMSYAIPAFLLLILIEAIINTRKVLANYRVNDTVNNFSTGMLEELINLFFKSTILFIYNKLYNDCSILHLSSNSIAVWLALWLSVDFCYYWLHRASHRCTFLWAGHSVHHQSEQYNLSVALRQGIIQAMFTWIFYLPLAVIGFPIDMFLLAWSANTIYQFWIHTKYIHTLGPLELVFNTPSHHRVHHGINPEYIDKNYAGSLIIWDKLFGTFQKENKPVQYGVTQALDSWNPFYANMKVFFDVWAYAKHFSNISDKIKAFIKPPEWVIHKAKELQLCTPTLASTPIRNESTLGRFDFLNLGIAIILFNWCLNATDLTLGVIAAMSTVLLSLLIIGLRANQQVIPLAIELCRGTSFVTFLLETTLSVPYIFGYTILYIVICAMPLRAPQDPLPAE